MEETVKRDGDGSCRSGESDRCTSHAEAVLLIFGASSGRRGDRRGDRRSRPQEEENQKEDGLEEKSEYDGDGSEEQGG